MSSQKEYKIWLKMLWLLCSIKSEIHSEENENGYKKDC